MHVLMKDPTLLSEKGTPFTIKTLSVHLLVKAKEQILFKFEFHRC